MTERRFGAKWQQTVAMAHPETGCAQVQQIHFYRAYRFLFKLQLYLARYVPPRFAPAIGRIRRRVGGLRMCIHNL